MKLAILGDIHGNLHALQAALEAADKAGCDVFLHTGDLVGYSARPNETVDLIKSRGIQGVRGNHDENVGCKGESPFPGRVRAGTAAYDAFLWTMRAVGLSQRVFLQNLPFSRDEKFDGKSLSLFHATPSDLYDPLFETVSDDRLDAIGKDTLADLNVFGHTHIPFHRVVAGRHFINAGSVGFSGGGDPRACLTLIELNGGVRSEALRVPYDTETAAREIEAAGLPAEISGRIRTGR